MLENMGSQRESKEPEMPLPEAASAPAGAASAVEPEDPMEAVRRANEQDKLKK
jgi:hypothetical protein